ncbi:hypothetical protein SERLADRAFT_399893, partial [Serpula lacrymans var. lacrymans S7.9]
MPFRARETVIRDTDNISGLFDAVRKKIFHRTRTSTIRVGASLFVTSSKRDGSAALPV